MKNSAKKNQIGFTLIEIMIALLIGLFLLGGLYQIFLSTKQSYRLSEAQSRLQENARYALEFLNHDIRLAGYFGCSGVTASNPVVIANDPLIAPYTQAGGDEALVVTSGNGGATGSFTHPSPALSSSPLTPVVKNTDAITVQFGESCGGFTTAATTSVNPATAAISANNSCGTITASSAAGTLGTPLVISDCATAHIFRASTNTSQNKDTTGGVVSAFPAAKSYPVGSEIMLYRAYTYFIRENAAGQPALYRIDNNDAPSVSPVELVEGIENLQITYGIDTDNDGSVNQYSDTPATVAPNVTIAVRIVLTIRTIEDNLAATARSYTYNNVAVTDRRLAQSITTTIALRNR